VILVRTDPGRAEPVIHVVVPRGLMVRRGPEPVFGGLRGVRLTRVGYTGGTKKRPTYHSLGGERASALTSMAAPHSEPQTKQRACTLCLTRQS
jgi:hypothetical protein